MASGILPSFIPTLSIAIPLSCQRSNTCAKCHSNRQVKSDFIAIRTDICRGNGQQHGKIRCQTDAESDQEAPSKSSTGTVRGKRREQNGASTGMQDEKKRR